MLDLIINKHSIAIIYQIKNPLVWKIAFGNSVKKILPDQYPTLASAIVEARRMGFGGYRTINYKTNAVKFSLKSILSKEIKKWTWAPQLFSDEKNWAEIYKQRHVWGW